MNKIYPHIKSNLQDWPIFKNSKFRSEFIADLNVYTKKSLLADGKISVEGLLEKTVYLENLRVKNNPWDVDPNDEKIYWKELGKEINQAKSNNDTAELESILERIINRYNEEIVGGFRAKTFRFARKFLTFLFKMIYNKFGEKLTKGIWGNKSILTSKLRVQGEVEKMRELFKHGTIVMVPTHSSNLDSILVGYTIDSVVGVPAFVYGAGLNLFNHEIVAYFMNRLGTYRVDRRKKNPIYLECLKNMASFSLQSGVNNLFFPGGTRSRDGKIEDRLKLGLLGSVVEAQRNAFMNGSKNKLFIFPVVMSYHFTLEAQGLIDQHLRRTAKEKYTKPSRQVKTSGSIIKFVRSLFTKESNYVFSIGEPIDVFGNPVDIDGHSLNKDGDNIDIRGYFQLDGSLEAVKQREKVYTKLLGEKIVESYYRNNVVLSSQVIAYVAFKRLLLENKSLELYDVLNLPAIDLNIDLEVFKKDVSSLLAFLREKESLDQLKLSEECSWELDEFLKDAFYHLGTYHPEAVLKINKNNQVESENFRLLYFYHNRLDSYKFDVNAFISEESIVELKEK